MLRRAMPHLAPARLARRLFHDLRIEGAGRGRDATALGAGAFIGCLPFYGFHLLLVAAVGRVLGLNRIKMYAAANISNPLMAPVLILLEVQAGAWLRRQQFHPLTMDAIRGTDPWVFGGDLMLGSLVVGAVIATVVAAATHAAVSHAPRLPLHIECTFASAAERYFRDSLTAWEFARAKLRRDPVYRAALDGLLPDGGTLADIGCGQGLTLAVLAEARHRFVAGGWPTDAVPPPRFDRAVGIEARARVATIARRALGDDADIVQAFAPDGLPRWMRAALLFDVLHLMGTADQERLVTGVFHQMEPEGVVLVREVDAAGGWGFHAVRVGNRVKNVAVGNWRQQFHFRSATSWRELFTRVGWMVEMRPMGQGTPFANVLFRLVKPGSARLHLVDPGARLS